MRQADRVLYVAAIGALALIACPAEKAPVLPPESPSVIGPHQGPYTLAHATADLPGTGLLMARLSTSSGTIVVRLHENRAPLTVANFVGLARGRRAWQDPKTGQWVRRPFYDGLEFHRVEPGFMVQAGCPIGDGTGGPGYRFPDEIEKTLRHDQPGVMSMANEGPMNPEDKSVGTNGSQFFITERPAPQLDGRHSVFGVVVEGLEVVRQLSRAPRDETTKRPSEPLRLEKVEIFRAPQEEKDAG